MECGSPLILAERSIESGLRCFLPLQEESGLIDGGQKAVLEELLTYFSNHCRKPDYTIYVRCEPQISMARIMIRDRKEESAIPPDYIKKLHLQHENWLIPLATKPGSNVLIFENGPNEEGKEDRFVSFARTLEQLVASN